MESSLKPGLQVQLVYISAQGRAAAFLVAKFSCLTHPYLTPPPTPASWAVLLQRKLGKEGGWSLGFLDFLVSESLQNLPWAAAPAEQPLSKVSWESLRHGSKAMGMHGNTPGYAICTKGRFRMLKSLVISESWLFLTKQAWKRSISFVCVFPEKLSSLSVWCSLRLWTSPACTCKWLLLSIWCKFWKMSTQTIDNWKLSYNGQFQAIIM